MSEPSSAPTTPPRPGPIARGLESGYLPALLTALAMAVPAALASNGASGELRSGLIAYAVPMSIAGSKAFAVTFSPLREWWARALAMPSAPFAPLLLMAGFLQAWTLMAACVTQVILQKTMGAMLSGGISGTPSSRASVISNLQGDLVNWLTGAPVLISMALIVVILLLFRGLSRTPGKTVST